ncbi:MAG: hypothetical protein II694_09955 [Lachnospiraceae bacterium]|nr:hypothetical protein [Lachnospiraceae bacterium]
MRYDLSGQWKIELPDGRGRGDGFLPGTLDENAIGDPDRVAKAWHPDIEDRSGEDTEFSDSEARITTRLTRNYIYEGPAEFSRVFDGDAVPGRRYLFFVERTRAARLFIDDTEAKYIASGLSTPTVFDVTGLIRRGCLLRLITDNTYPGMPYRDITFSSAATDETQTNWNGAIGEIYLEETGPARIAEARVLPEIGAPGTADVVVEVDAADTADMRPADMGTADTADMGTVLLSAGSSDRRTVPMSGQTVPVSAFPAVLRLEGACLEAPVEKELLLSHGAPAGIRFEAVPLSSECTGRRWDEYEGNLHELRITLLIDGKAAESKTVCFGLRTFSYDDTGRLTLNGRRIFLRSEANCGLFPETGHPPMDLANWIKIVETYRSYGVNCIRFHSWCPPEAAFEAADRLGVMIEAELPNWNPRDAFNDDSCFNFYKNELIRIIKSYANHPSFVMLALGNELHASDEGVEKMHSLLQTARELDPTRLYAWGSNNFYGNKGADPDSDFYTGSDYYGEPLRFSGNRGTINATAPNTRRDLSAVLGQIRKNYKKPVFTFEVGQYEILPDMKELADFKGVTRPDNLTVVDERRRKNGISDEEWERRVNATGEIALKAYREEIEGVLRTPGLSGISLLGLQDFTGQGTALVGMLNSHLQPKPYPFSDPARFAKFFTGRAVLVLFDRYTYETGETFTAEVKVANYGRELLPGEFSYTLKAAASGHGYDSAASAPGSSAPSVSEPENTGLTFASGHRDTAEAGTGSCPPGALTSLGTFEITLRGFDRAQKLMLTVTVGDISAEYPLWVYPHVDPVCPANVYETEVFDDTAKEILSKGGRVYVTPHSAKEAIPDSIQAQFTTDFWSVGTFPAQEGAMGQLIKKDHPVFKDFPTDEWSDWQWFRMASQRAFILPRYTDAIITEMDCYVRQRPMAQLYEAKCGAGRVLYSSMGLQDLQEYPEARMLLDCIYRYLGSEDFEPVQEL